MSRYLSVNSPTPIVQFSLRSSNFTFLFCLQGDGVTSGLAREGPVLGRSILEERFDNVFSGVPRSWYSVLSLHRETRNFRALHPSLRDSEVSVCAETK